MNALRRAFGNLYRAAGRSPMKQFLPTPMEEMLTMLPSSRKRKEKKNEAVACTSDSHAAISTAPPGAPKRKNANVRVDEEAGPTTAPIPILIQSESQLAL